ncbi:DUF3795 domain-containing protein [Chloroflexota bacterium]
MDAELIAPCGMNCHLCSGYLAYKNDIKSEGIRAPYCVGCRPRDKKCAFLKKLCDLLMNNKVDYCYECGDFPCERLKRIDGNYQKLYRMSMIENLEYIKENGTRDFLKKEEGKWKCPECWGTICCHNGICYSCGLETLRTKVKKYRWEDD